MQTPMRMAGQNLAQSLGVPYPDGTAQGHHGYVDARIGQAGHAYHGPLQSPIAMAARMGAFASE
jgi:hypothetical protein